MSQIKNPELLLVTAGGRIQCRRCTAKSSYTQMQCKRPALKASTTFKCASHGGLSTGPKTKEGKDRIRAAHLKHGQETQEARANRSDHSLMFRYLTDLGNHINLFQGELKTRGRPHLGYSKPNLNDSEQLAFIMMKMLPKKSSN